MLNSKLYLYDTTFTNCPSYEMPYKIELAYRTSQVYHPMSLSIFFELASILSLYRLFILIYQYYKILI